MTNSATKQPGTTIEKQEIRIRGESAWQLSWRRFRRHKVALFGGTIIMLLILTAVFAPLLTPFDPAKINPIFKLKPPGFQAPADHANYAKNCVADQVLLWKCGFYPFGTDDLGRDIMTRVMYGARVSLIVGFVAALVGTFLGTILGAIAAFWGGTLDAAISRFVEIMLSIPQLPLLLILVGLLSNPSLHFGQWLNQTFGGNKSILIIIFVIIITSWMGITRLVRGEVLSLREREFVDAARGLGFTRARIIFKHLLPNVSHVIIVQATLQVGEAILVESGLSFLGLGIQPPAVSWGNMLALAQNFLYYPNGVFIALFPGLFIILTVLTFNFVGDGLRDALDPRSTN